MVVVQGKGGDTHKMSSSQFQEEKTEKGLREALSLT